MYKPSTKVFKKVLLFLAKSKMIKPVRTHLKHKAFNVLFVKQSLVILDSSDCNRCLRHQRLVSV